MNQTQEVPDSVRLEERVKVIRYKGSKNIREMMQTEQYIEAFVHAQLGIEKILWDKIVGLFEGRKAMRVRRNIDEGIRGEDRSPTQTFELIRWAHFLEAISDAEFSDLLDFNKKRNDIVHGHGQWWYLTGYKAALEKATRFLEKNGM